MADLGRNRGAFWILLALWQVSNALPARAEPCSHLVTDPVTYESLQSTIQACHIQSIDSLLPLLPRDFRSSFTLMRQSKSSQEASDAYPRVIMFGKDAKLMIAFNGDPAQKGYNNLEIIQFRDQSRSFEFNEIEFSADSRSVPRFHRSPKSCTSCHRDPGRPNWEAYDVWPGAYGQVEDQIKVGSDEDHSFQLFLKNRNKGRYQYLVGSPDLKGKSIAEVAGKDKGTPAKAYSVATNPNFRLTFFLNQINYQRIAEQLRKTPQFDQFKYAIYGALFGCGPIDSFLPPKVAASIGKSASEYEKETYQILDNQYARRIANIGPFDKFDIFDGEAPQNFEGNNGSKRIIAKLRYLIEGRGISMKDWSLSTDPDAYTYSDGDVYIKDVARSFEPELKSISGLTLDYVPLEESNSTELFGQHSKDFKGLKRFSCCEYDAGPGSMASNNCKLLKELSLKSLSGIASATAGASQSTNCPPSRDPSVPVPGSLEPSLSASRIVLAQGLIARCVECHRAGNGTGLIFHDLESLKSQLGRTGFKRGTLMDEVTFRLKAIGAERMPPGSTETHPEERSALIDLLTGSK